jgi:hypothetical protein
MAGVQFLVGTSDFAMLQLALGSIKPSIQWVPGVISPEGVNQLGHEADHTPPIASVKNVGVTPPLPIHHRDVVLN